MRRVLAVLAVATTAAVGWAATAMAHGVGLVAPCSSVSMRVDVLLAPAAGHMVVHRGDTHGPVVARVDRTLTPMDTGLVVSHTEAPGTALWVDAWWDGDRDHGSFHAPVTVEACAVAPAVVPPAPPVAVPPARPVAPRAHGHKRHAHPRHRARRECRPPRRMLAGKCRRVVTRRVPRTAG